MQGSYDIVIRGKNNYEDNPVEAFSVEPQNEGGSSSGYYEQGIRINWVSPGGISGSGWYTHIDNSPFYGKVESQIESDASVGNLNSYFKSWGNNQSIDREKFIKEVIPDTCWTIII